MNFQKDFLPNHTSLITFVLFFNIHGNTTKGSVDSGVLCNTCGHVDVQISSCHQGHIDQGNCPATRVHCDIKIQVFAFSHFWVHSPSKATVCVDVHYPCYHRNYVLNHLLKCENHAVLAPYLIDPRRANSCLTRELTPLLPGPQIADLVTGVTRVLALPLGKAGSTPHYGHGRTGSTPHLAEIPELQLANSATTKAQHSVIGIGSPQHLPNL